MTKERNFDAGMGGGRNPNAPPKRKPRGTFITIEDSHIPLDASIQQRNPTASFVDAILQATHHDTEAVARMILGREIDESLGDQYERFQQNPYRTLHEFAAGAAYNPFNDIEYSGSGSWMGWSEEEIEAVLGRNPSPVVNVPDEDEDAGWMGWSRADLSIRYNIHDSAR